MSVTHLKVKVSTGTAKSHFGEFLQGVFMTKEGLFTKASVVALVDPKPPLKNQIDYVFETGESGSVATFSTNGKEGVVVEPSTKTKSLSAAYRTLLEIDYVQSGILNIVTAKDTCSGMGRSTSDVVSSIRAICNFYDVKLSSEMVAKIAVNSEIASDGIMYDKAILFATEKAEVLRNYKVNHPDLEVIGADCSGEKYDINTLQIPIWDYTKQEKKRFYALERTLYQALENKNFGKIARVATESAIINQKYLPKDNFNELRKIAMHNDVPGILCSHSGTALGLLIDPLQIPSRNTLKNIKSDMESIGFTNIKRYSNYINTA